MDSEGKVIGIADGSGYATNIDYDSDGVLEAVRRMTGPEDEQVEATRRHGHTDLVQSGFDSEEGVRIRWDESTGVSDDGDDLFTLVSQRGPVEQEIESEITVIPEATRIHPITLVEEIAEVAIFEDPAGGQTELWLFEDGTSKSMDSLGTTTITSSEPDPISNYATDYVTRVVQEVGFCHTRESTCPEEPADVVTSTTVVDRQAHSVLNPETGCNRELTETTLVNGRLYSREVE